MKNLPAKLALLLLPVMFLAACSSLKQKQSSSIPAYKPDSPELFDQIVKLDSIFFNAYNTCDLDKQADFYSDSLEFYHDQTGLSTSKKDVLDAIKTNICGKVTRELIKESVEVYPLKGFGAVEIGLHRFHNNTQKQDTPSEPGKFIIIWKQTGDNWKITRVVSLH